MILRISFIVIVTLLTGVTASGQVEIRTEYIGNSRYRDIDNEKTEGRGHAKIYSAGFNIPLKMSPTDDNRINAWMVSFSGDYTGFYNENLSRQLCPPEILNVRTGLTHIRPFKRKWSLLTAAGVGIYTSHTRLGSITFNEVMFDGAVAFIWHLHPKLDLGFGVAINNSFGFPMGFPALLLKWRTEGDWEIDLHLMNAATVTAGRKFGEVFKLGVTFEAGGSMAMEKISGKRMMFSHSYMVTGFRPEFRIGKMITIPLIAGITADRTAYYEQATLKAIFKSMGREYDPRFGIAPYFSAAVRIGF